MRKKNKELIRCYDCTKCDFSTMSTHEVTKCKVCGAELKLIEEYYHDPKMSLGAVENSRNVHLRKGVNVAIQQPKPTNTPHCPTCGSTDIQKISGMKRWLSVGLFGLASSDVGKTMVCKKCGYKF